MKKFLSGVLCATLVFSLALSALAISGRMTIEVDPINVQVNGEVFHPTDVNGKEVPVFAYQGTTYAPLRALAEAYGLEVGYDKAANMATVSDPDVKTPDTTTPDTTAKADYSDWSAEDEAAYQEFKGMWEYTFERATSTWNSKVTDRAIYLAELKDENTQFDISQLQADAKYNMILMRAAEEVNTSGYQNVTIRYPFGLVEIIDGNLHTPT